MSCQDLEQCSVGDRPDPMRCAIVAMIAPELYAWFERGQGGGSSMRPCPRKARGEGSRQASEAGEFRLAGVVRTLRMSYAGAVCCRCQSIDRSFLEGSMCSFLPREVGLVVGSLCRAALVHGGIPS